MEEAARLEMNRFPRGTMNQKHRHWKGPIAGALPALVSAAPRPALQLISLLLKPYRPHRRH
jgi:hypothetical protein